SSSETRARRMPKTFAIRSFLLVVTLGATALLALITSGCSRRSGVDGTLSTGLTQDRTTNVSTHYPGDGAHPNAAGTPTMTASQRTYTKPSVDELKKKLTPLQFR